VPSSLPPSIVRTVVPLVVAWLLSWLPAELELTEGQLGTAVTLALAAAYYIVVRLIEVYVSPRIGVLLGSRQTPAYGKHDARAQ
jgi:hypothetical protein